MVLDRVIMGVAWLATAGAAHAATGRPVQLPLSLAVLGQGAEVTYQPRRWLTIRSNLIPVSREIFEQGDTIAPVAPLRRTQSLTGDIHPFGNGLRLTIGLREQSNRRALRTVGDAGDIGTARYRPLVAIGYAAEPTPGLSIAAAAGMIGRPVTHGDGVELITPIEQVARRDSGAGPILQVSAGYRF